MQTIYLSGSEQVQNAGRSMRDAAEQMSRAASEITEAVSRQSQHFDSFLIVLERILAEDRDARMPIPTLPTGAK